MKEKITREDFRHLLNLRHVDVTKDSGVLLYGEEGCTQEIMFSTKQLSNQPKSQYCIGIMTYPEINKANIIKWESGGWTKVTDFDLKDFDISIEKVDLKNLDQNMYLEVLTSVVDFVITMFH